MLRLSGPHAGCMAYLILSIVINLLILILRISAQEMQNHSTVSTVHQFDTVTVVAMRTTVEEVGSEIGTYDIPFFVLVIMSKLVHTSC